MAKRKKREKQRKSKGAGRWIIIAAVIMAVLGLGGWWLFGDGPRSELKTLCLKKISVMADRVDELTQAWESRSDASPSSGRNHETTPPTTAAARPAEKPERPAPPAAAVEPAAPKPDVDVTPQDQQQLQEFFKNLDQSR